jgi:hypothetical protein
MDTRPSWQKIPAISTSLFDFKWTPYSSHIKYDLLGKHGAMNLVNHFEYHHCITQKDSVFNNIQKTCEQSHKDVFDHLPLTFVLDNTDKSQFESHLDKFTAFFNTIEKHKAQGITAVNSAINTSAFTQKKSKYVLRDSMLEGQNLWVCKPNDFNRGRGVTLF